MSGRFAFLNDDWEATEREIMSLIKEFAAKIRELKRKYPDCGIGDTETDELIIMEIYDQIHQE